MIKSRHQVTLDPKNQALTDAQAMASEVTRDYQQKARAPATWRAYENDWRRFETWCRRLAYRPMPATPTVVADFISAEAAAGLSPSTIGRRLAAIRAVHAKADLPSPCRHEDVILTMQGIRRDWNKPVNKKTPLLAADIKRLADVCDDSTRRGARDRALILLGFAGALRRSELTNLTVEDLEVQPEGLLVTITNSKTDQVGEGQTIAIPHAGNSPYCPVRAIEHWLDLARIDTGAVFRSMRRGDAVQQFELTAQSVALILKKIAEMAGLNNDEIAGHSLRRGFLTSASRNKASLFKMAAVSRHRSLQTLREYVEEAEQFNDHAGSGLL